MACLAVGRDPATLPLSLMTGVVVGRTRDEVRERGRRLYEHISGPGDLDNWLAERGEVSLIGTVDEVAARLRSWRPPG